MTVASLTSSLSNLLVPRAPKSFAFFWFFQNNSILNRHGSFLDLIFCNSSHISVVASSYPIVPLDFYHSPLHILCPGAGNLPHFNNSHTFHNLCWADYPSIITFISTFDWNSTFSVCDVNCTVSLFIDTLHASIIRFVPLVTFYLSNFQVWASHVLKKNLIRLKNKVHDFLSTLNPIDYHLSLVFLLCVNMNLENAIISLLKKPNPP